MSKIIDLYEKIEEKRFDLECAKKEFLRATGWKESCDHPGAYYLWRKEVRGVVIAVGLDLAVGIASNMLEPTAEGDSSEV